MHNCPTCSSLNLIKNGVITLANKSKKTRYKCKECGTRFSVSDVVSDVEFEVPNNLVQGKKYVVTSAINGSKVNRKFFDLLVRYCTLTGATLLVMPVKHRQLGKEISGMFDPMLEPYLARENVYLHEYNTKILSELHLSSSLENPLAGVDAISKGSNLVLGHPQVQLKTLPRMHSENAPIVTTTGTVSERNYSNSKPGTKASFNHSLSAVLLDLGDEVFIRHLNYCDSTESFYDLGIEYSEKNFNVQSRISALITGDEHAVFSDPDVKIATYTGKKSLTAVLRPEYIIRHDVFDAYAISHHHEKDIFIKYTKFMNGMCKVQDELDLTIKHILETTPKESKSVIVQSNHNEHLYRWLNECDPSTQPWNAKLYHKLMYLMLESVELGEKADPFEMYSKDRLSECMFVDRNADFKIQNIQLNMHGDIGSNGSRGSRKQFTLLPLKSIIGHSHSPGIDKAVYQTGTSSVLRMEYNKGPSSWDHAHCIINPNGKRQLIFIRNGKYRN